MLLSIKWIAFIIASLFSQFLRVNHAYIVLYVPVFIEAIFKKDP